MIDGWTSIRTAEDYAGISHPKHGEATQRWRHEFYDPLCSLI